MYPMDVARGYMDVARGYKGFAPWAAGAALYARATKNTTKREGGNNCPVLCFVLVGDAIC